MLIPIASTVEFIFVRETFMWASSSSSLCALVFRLSISSITDIMLSILASLAFVSHWKFVRSALNFFHLSC